MQASDGSHGHRVAVVRVEVRGRRPAELLVVVLEVGPDGSADRVLGTAATPAAAGALIYDWLLELAWQ